MTDRLTLARHGLVAVVLIGATLQSFAQDSRPVPDYRAYMTSCVAAAKPPKGFGDSVSQAVEEANCQCKFERLPQRTMTKEQFFAAAAACQRESAASGVRSFTEKYYSRIKRGPAAQSASRDSHTIKYGSGNIALRADCTATSSQYGNGTWGWANGGIVVDLAKRKDIGFARMESPFEDDRCRL